MKKIDLILTEQLIIDARESDRKRKNLNFHRNSEDRIHRMIHATNPTTYVQPHKHENPDKTETFLILKGRVIIAEFSDDGEIIDHIILASATGNYGVEIPPKTWHTLITLEENSLVYEVKDGPWNPKDDKFFASWAPEEGQSACEDYNKSILSKLNLL